MTIWCSAKLELYFSFAVTLSILFLYSTGTFAADNLFGVYSLLILSYLFTSQEKLKPDVRALSGLLLISVVGIAASSLSKFPEISFSRLTIYRDLFLLGFAFYLFFQSRLVDSANLIFLAIVLVFLYTTPTTITEYFSFAANPENDRARYISPQLTYYGHIRHYSYHAFIASCSSVLLVYLNSQYRVLSGLLATLCVVALLMSTGRGAMLSLFIFAILLLSAHASWKQLIKFSILFATLAVIVLGILALTPYSSITESILLRTQHFGSLDQILSGRVGFWTKGLESISATPILGLGPEGYRWSEGVLPGIRQPHNSVVQMLIEYGYFGGTVILLVICALAMPLFKIQDWRPSAQRNLHQGLNCFILAYLCYGLVDGLFYHLLPMLHLSFLIPIWFCLSKRSGPVEK